LDMEPSSNYPNRSQSPSESRFVRSSGLCRSLVATAAFTLIFAATTMAGCGGPAMMPGSRCGSCHDGDEAPKFGTSGTLYDSVRDGTAYEGATVTVTAADGHRAILKTVHGGNFYTKTALTLPLQVTVSRNGVSRSMNDAPSGDCNSCHTDGTSPGRIHIP
jgi:hypothetical protein